MATDYNNNKQTMNRDNNFFLKPFRALNSIIKVLIFSFFSVQINHLFIANYLQYRKEEKINKSDETDTNKNTTMTVRPSMKKRDSSAKMNRQQSISQINIFKEKSLVDDETQKLINDFSILVTKFDYNTMYEEKVEKIEGTIESQHKKTQFDSEFIEKFTASLKDLHDFDKYMLIKKSSSELLGVNSQDYNKILQELKINFNYNFVIIDKGFDKINQSDIFSTARKYGSTINSEFKSKNLNNLKNTLNNCFIETKDLR